VVKPERDETPVLITAAARSFEDDLAARRRKYLTVMLVRMSCLVIAGVVYEIWWLAVAFVLLSIPLPWIAVLVANDRSPRKDEDVNRYQPSRRAVENGEHVVIDERP
jgi:hypothetical protein